MGVFEAMRAAGYAVAVCRQAFVDSGRPRHVHRDYDAALKRAEDALVNAEAEVDVLEPASGGRVFDCVDKNAIALLKADPDLYFHITKQRHLSKAARDALIAAAVNEAVEDEAWDANEDFDARREARTETWLRDTDSPVEGSGDATGGVNSPPSVVPLSELVDQVADELRAQHQPHWLADKVRATALMLKTQGL